jgi:hypothetical protein
MVWWNRNSPTWWIEKNNRARYSWFFHFYHFYSVKFGSQKSLNDSLKALDIFKNIYKGDHECISNQLNNIETVCSDMKQHETAFK